ncbi:hypothetical protein KJ582_01315 [bacterium]|nr:hypothetical protein [bacterium]
MVIGICVLYPGALFCQEVYLEVTKEVAPKIRINISLEGKEVTQVLASDLERSGYFKLTSQEEAEIILKGECQQIKEEIVAEVSLFSINQTSPFYLLKGRDGDERRLAHRLANQVVERLTGKKGIALSKIVANYQTEKRKEIVLFDYDGANERLITTDYSLNLFPRFSPDNASLLYTSYLRYWPEVILHHLNTGKREIVASYPGLNSASSFSLDGKHILLTLSKDGNPEIYLLILANRKLERLTRNQAIDTSSIFLPDGNSIIFVSDRSGSPQIYRLNLKDNSLKRMTFEGSYNTSPAISPSGDYLAYASRVSNQIEIFLLEMKSGDSFCLTSGLGNKEDPSFASDGRHLVFTLTKDYSSNLYMLDIFSREIYPITTKGGYSSPNWSK